MLALRPIVWIGSSAALGEFVHPLGAGEHCLGPAHAADDLGITACRPAARGLEIKSPRSGCPGASKACPRLHYCPLVPRLRAVLFTIYARYFRSALGCVIVRGARADMRPDHGIRRSGWSRRGGRGRPPMILYRANGRGCAPPEAPSPIVRRLPPFPHPGTPPDVSTPGAG